MYRHDKEECVFKKDPEVQMVYVSEEEKKDFNIGMITPIAKVHIYQRRNPPPTRATPTAKSKGVCVNDTNYLETTQFTICEEPHQIVYSKHKTTQTTLT
ncbi:hypothetical protein C2G38_2222439 [Gigaspora rosea]|uniref:Uncharacterized protein n=1 Tax=Gigaspora rosea TaxID=44941 RepID=A0A397U2H7_9GLOM|nr:hypothetical protein C2G38_2222439 [Gigaspora rosea]